MLEEQESEENKDFEGQKLISLSDLVEVESEEEILDESDHDQK